MFLSALFGLYFESYGTYCFGLRLSILSCNNLCTYCMESLLSLLIIQPLDYCTFED